MLLNVLRYIPQRNWDGVCFFHRDDRLADTAANGFGVPYEALEFGFDEYVNNHGANWYKVVWWSMWALLYRFKPKHIFYALSSYVVDYAREHWKPGPFPF